MAMPNNHNPTNRTAINSTTQFHSYPFFNPHSRLHFTVKRKNKSSLIITMASLLFLSLISLLRFFSISAADTTNHHHYSRLPHSPKPKPNSPSPEILQACKSTRYPNQCQSQLNSQPQTAPSSPLQIIQSALTISTQNLKTASSMVQNILSTSADSLNRSRAAKTCLEYLGNSDRRTQTAADALSRLKMKDARAWASAALCYQYDCWSGLQYVNDTKSVGETMSFINDTLLVSTSNAVSMMVSYDLFGNNTESWGPPKTERDGFWEVGGESGSEGLGFMGGFPTGLNPDATVCKGGKGKGCLYETVQEAVDAAPTSGLVGKKKFVIHIKEGVYEEIVRVGFEKKNLVFLGDGIGKTVITGSVNTGLQGITTYNTATVGVLGDGFMAKDLTIQNTAGPSAHQAVAFRSDSDLTYIENVEFLGNQDTLYAHSLRQLYKSCHIQGNVDFIFGNAAAIFQNCTILVRPRQLNPTKGENNAISAHGRTDPSQSTGFAFLSCLINGTDEYVKLYDSKPKVHKNFLGRPWKEFSRTVFIDCMLERIITPGGWLPFRGKFALGTLYYGEYGNKGAGADLDKRVAWSSKIPSEHVNAYSAANFIQGDEFTASLSLL